MYQEITGGDIGSGPRLVGGMLFSGPIGALAAVFAGLVEEASGDSIDNHIASPTDDVTGANDAPEGSALNAPRREKRNGALLAAQQMATQPVGPTGTPKLCRDQFRDLTPKRGFVAPRFPV